MCTTSQVWLRASRNSLLRASSRETHHHVGGPPEPAGTGARVWHSPDVLSPSLERAIRPRTRRSPVLLAALGLVVVQLALRGWALYGSWFQFDDFAFISRMIDQPLTPGLVLDGYGGHLMPAGFALTWLFVRADPLGFTAYAITLLVLQAVASLGMVALLRSLFGSRWGILPPLALYLFSALSLPAFIWWAAGVNQLALQVALTWGLLAHLTYLRTRRLRWVLVTALVMVGCLAFYEKVLLVYGAIAILTLAYFASGTFFDRVRQVWARYRAGLLVHVACGAAYIAVYLAVGVQLPGGGNGADFPLLALTGTMVGRSLVPGLLGGPVTWEVLSGPFQLADPGSGLVVASCLALVALVVHLDRSTARTRRAWALPLFFLGSDIALIGAARASVLGPVIGREFRYLTELGLVCALGLALATLPVRGAVESLERRTPSPFLDSREWVALATVTVCLLAGFSSVRYAQHWKESDQAREYFAHADESLGTPTDPTPLANVSVPQYIMWGYDYPRNTTRYVLGMFAARMSFPEASVDHLYVVGDDGLVTPAGVTSERAAVPPLGPCGYRAATTHTAQVLLDQPVADGEWWVRMSYVAQQDTDVTIQAGTAVHEVTLRAGLRNVYFQSDGALSSIAVRSTTPGATVCVADAALGFAVPLVAGAS